MALIIEDGSIVADADSYAETAEFRTYCQTRGIELTLCDDDIDVLLIKAMNYMESAKRYWQGCKVSATQSLKWPRYNVWVDGSVMPSDEIPRNILYGQLSLAVESMSNDLQPNRLPSDTGAVKSEKLEGVGEIVYSSDSPRMHTPAFSKPEELLLEFYEKRGLQLVRS